MKRIGYFASVLAVLILVGIQLSPAWMPFFEKDGQKIQICTLQGIKTIVFDADGLPVEQEEEHQPIQHCPLCMLRTAALFVPQTIDIPLPLLLEKTGGITAETAQTRSLQTYALFRPRDPPFTSA